MIKRIILTTLLVTFAGTGMSAQAQILRQPSRDRDRDRTSQVREQFEQRLDKLVDDADRFRSSFESAVDDNRLNNSRRRDRVNGIARDFEDQARRVRDRFGDNQSIRDDAQTLFNQADRLDSFLQSNRLDRNTIRDWARVRDDVNQLRDVFNRFGNSGNFNNDNYWRR